MYLKIHTTLQELWGFPQNMNYIKTWKYPYCKCPKTENDDRYPYGPYWTSEDCPIHG
jgi:hypothetical protein